MICANTVAARRVERRSCSTLVFRWAQERWRRDFGIETIRALQRRTVCASDGTTKDKHCSQTRQQAQASTRSGGAAPQTPVPTRFMVMANRVLVYRDYSILASTYTTRRATNKHLHLGTGSDGSSPSSSQSSRQLDIFLLDGDALGVNCAQVCVVEEIHQEGLGGFLQRKESLRLPSARPILSRYALCNLSDLRNR